MKVLLIGPFPLPVNGCSYANEVLLKNLQLQNITCSFINTNTSTISSKQGSRFSIRKAVSFFKTYFKTFKIAGASAVYITPGQTFFGMIKYSPFILFCKLLRKPYVIHLHGNFMGKEYAGLKGMKRRIFFFLVSGAAAGIVLSGSLRVNFEQLLPHNRVHVVENFIDESLRTATFKKNDKQLQVLYLSNLMREKGILELLDGLILLKKRHVNFKATVAGAMESGIEEEFKSRAETLNSSLKYAGTVTGAEKLSVLSEANVFVLPTYYQMEGQPISLLEAMGAGNIIITTAHAGIPDIVDSRNGFFVKKKSPEAIADCLENISLNLAGMVAKYAEHNTVYTATTFTEKRFTDKIIKILHAVSKT